MTRLLILLSICFCACEDSANETAKALAPGLTAHSMVFGGVTRTFTIHAPDAIDTSQKYPLLFAFHGGNNEGPNWDAAWSGYVASEKIITIYPQGVNGFWNVGIGFSSADDVGFVREITDYLKANVRVDTARIYAMGFSMGAMLCHKLAREANFITAIAPVSGLWLTTDAIAASQPNISVMYFHGGADVNVPFNGGVIQGTTFQVISAFSMMNTYATHNGCGSGQATIDSSASVVNYQFGSCNDVETKVRRFEEESHFISTTTWNTIYPVMWTFLKTKVKL